MTDTGPEPIDAVLARAIAALEDLAERGEAIADEWQYVNDLLRIHAADLRALAAADARPVAPAGVRAVDLLIDESGRIADPHRAIDWLSTFPQVARLALELRSQRVRFQDAARDARAIVYAGIQADPLVARIAGLLADASAAQLVLARAVMNGETTDPATWRAMFPTLFEADGRARDAQSEEILAAALEVADRGEQVRSQFRGAIVEELTARLLARRVPAASIRRERRVLFDGVPAEIHPYDVTVETDGRAEVYDCKWGARGISADVLHQLDDARRHAAAEDERLFVALVLFDSRRSCEVRLARSTVPREGTRLFTLETLGRLAGRKA